jgi:hypothetical protein
MWWTKHKDITEAVYNGTNITQEDIESWTVLEPELSEHERSIGEIKAYIQLLIDKYYGADNTYDELLSNIMKWYEYGNFSFLPILNKQIFRQQEIEKESIVQLIIVCVLIRLDGKIEDISFLNDQLVSTRKFIEVMSLYAWCYITEKEENQSRINLKLIYDEIELNGMTNKQQVFSKKWFIPSQTETIRLDNGTIELAEWSINFHTNQFYESPEYVINIYESSLPSISVAYSSFEKSMDMLFSDKVIKDIYWSFLKLVPFKKVCFEKTGSMFSIAILWEMNTFKTTTMAVWGYIVGYDKTVVFDCSNQTPYPVLSHLSAFDYVIFIDEISRVSKIKTFVQDLLISNYNQNEVKRWDRARASSLSKNICYTNNSMLVLWWQGYKFDPATLSRCIQLTFYKQWTVNMLKRNEMEEVKGLWREWWMYFLQHKKEIDFDWLYMQAEEYVSKNYTGVDRRLFAKMVFVVVGMIQ